MNQANQPIDDQIKRYLDVRKLQDNRLQEQDRIRRALGWELIEMERREQLGYARQ